MKPGDVFDRELDRLERRIESGTGGFWAGLRNYRTTLLVLPIAIAILHWRGVPAQLSKATLDAAIALQSRTEPKQVRIIVIDDQDYGNLFGSKSPLDTAVLSQLLAAIAAARPSLAVVDIDTSDQSFRDLGVPPDLRIIWAMTDQGWKEGRFVCVSPLGGRILARSWTQGLAEVPKDGSRVVRAYWRVFPTSQGPVPSIELAAAEAYRGRQFPAKLLPPSKNERTLDFRYAFYPMNARSVLEYAKQPGWPDGVLRDKIVILGGSYRVGRDHYATPVGMRDGVEIVAQATQAEIDDTGIPNTSSWLGVLEVLAGLAVIAVYQLFRLRTAVLVSLILLPVLSMAGSFLLYRRLAAWLALMPVLVIVLISELYAKAAMYRKLSSNLLQLASKRQDVDRSERPREVSH
jgi:CHASE2 domain-containing sensor protein